MNNNRYNTGRAVGKFLGKLLVVGAKVALEHYAQNASGEDNTNTKSSVVPDSSPQIISSRPIASKIPDDDIGKLELLHEIDSNCMACLWKSRRSSSDSSTSTELLQVIEDYNSLLNAPMPSSFIYTEEEIMLKIADAYGLLAGTYSNAQDYAKAKEIYEINIELYKALNKQDMADRAQDNLDSCDFSQNRNIDKEISRWQQKLNRVEKNTVEHAEILVGLGLAYKVGEDNLEAIRLLTEAEKILDNLSKSGGMPSGEDIASALFKTVDAIENEQIEIGQVEKGTTDIQVITTIMGMYELIYTQLMRMYQDSDKEKAGTYKQKRDQRHSREKQDTFSKKGRELLLSGLSDEERNRIIDSKLSIDDIFDTKTGRFKI